MSFNSIKDAHEIFKNSDNEIMFIHIREPEEIERAKIKFNAKTLLIKRESYDNITSNSSDANVENYNYDFVINNSTLENLELEAKNFVDTLRNL